MGKKERKGYISVFVNKYFLFVLTVRLPGSTTNCYGQTVTKPFCYDLVLLLRHLGLQVRIVTKTCCYNLGLLLDMLLQFRIVTMTVCNRMCCKYYSILYGLSQLLTFANTFPSFIIALNM